jgi:DNA-directed RNA polymerase specialized sigma24 family protein
VTRSKGSSRISALEPQGEKNFFEFYEKHTGPVDEILTAQIFSTRFDINPDDEGDLRQDILFKLHRCNILGQFDRGKSAFNTYLTGKINCYVRIWLRQKNHNEHPRWSPRHANSEGEKSLRYEREYYSSLNGINQTQSDRVLEDLPGIDGIDEEYSKKEMLQILLKNIPENLKSLVKLLLSQELTCGEIAKMVHSSPSAVYEKYGRVKAYGRKILKDRSSF